MERHYIPDIDLSLENFEEFVLKRRELLINAFKRLLRWKIRGPSSRVVHD